MSLSVCMVTRDAEDRVGTALVSLIPLGCQVIVADTGSKDRTADLARSLGAQVVAVPWADDFADAQNRALERATGDWVLWLNPDEEYLRPDVELLHEIIARRDALAFLVNVTEMVDPARPGHVAESLQPRLFRRHPEFRFIGRVHPHLWPPVDEVARRENKQIATCDVLLRRHAYLSVLTEDKLRWATRLLALELRDRPGQLHYMIEFGRNLLRLNDADGHGVLAEAAEMVLAVAGKPFAPTPNVASLLEYALTVSPSQRVTALTPLVASELVGKWFPNSPPLVWLLAERAFRAEQFTEAEKQLEWLGFLSRSGTFDRSMPFDPSLIGESATLNLGVCRLRLGNADGAEECFRAVANRPGYEDRARRGLEEVAALRRRLPGA